MDAQPLDDRTRFGRLAVWYAVWFKQSEDLWHRDWARYYAKLADGETDVMARITFAPPSGDLTDDDLIPIATAHGPILYGIEHLREQ